MKIGKAMKNLIIPANVVVLKSEHCGLIYSTMIYFIFYDATSFFQQPSSNFDDSGFFSIQVIQKAVKVWGLETLPFNSQDPLALQAREDPT